MRFKEIVKQMTVLLNYKILRSYFYCYKVAWTNIGMVTPRSINVISLRVIIPYFHTITELVNTHMCQQLSEGEDDYLRFRLNLIHTIYLTCHFFYYQGRY